MTVRGKRLSLAVWGVSMWAIMIFGYNQSAAGGVLVTKSFNEQFPKMDTLFTTGNKQKHNSTIQGTVVAMYTICGTFGALACSALGDVFGRRRTIFTAAATSGIGAILMATSYSFAQFIIARMVTGFGTGGIIATVSVWQSELSKAQHRGSHVSGFGIFCGGGLALATWIDFAFSFTSGSVSWRFPLSVPAIAALVVMGTVFLVPESPRWLIKAQRVDEARDIISRIYDTTIDANLVSKEVSVIQRSIELGGQASLASIFKMGPGRTLHRVVLAVVIQMFLQLSGINSVAYYAPAVFQQQLHFSPILSGILAASSQLCLVLGAIICSFTVDRFGRRKLMLGSASSMAVCMALLAGLTSNPRNTGALKAAVAFVYLYYLVYVLGFLGIPFLYASEVAPSHLRGPICGISTAVSWLFNFLVVEVTPVAFTNIGSRYFIVYAVINAACVVVVYLFYPETSGWTLEEIDAIFVSSKSIFDSVRIARSKNITDITEESSLQKLDFPNKKLDTEEKTGFQEAVNLQV